jgi:Fur family peroxide stress response transcriptional regulator
MEKYRDRGLKLTPQRIAIFDYLEGNKKHPSAEDIYRAVSKKFPTMSFATVYNTLAALRDRGTIRELTIDAGKKRYDPDSSQHHHLICVSCRQVIDIAKNYRLDLPEQLKESFTISSNHVEFHGICSACKKRKERK